MRERTTWNRTQIRQAAVNKKADPYTMNQDHVQQQPEADDYVIGGPSDFAEDVNKENRWETEYSGGAVKRDEIGMPEKRPETYNHPEKTASEAVLLKKAELTVKVARMMLPKTATEAAVEDQAYGLMYMPDAELIHTFDRLANQDEVPVAQEPPAQQAPVAQQPPAQQAPVAQGQDLQAMVQQMVQQAMQQQACGNMACGKQAQEQEKKQGEDEPKPAQQEKKAEQQMFSQEQIQQMIQQAVQQAQAQQQAPQAPQAQQQAPQAPVAEQPPVQSDDALLDNMLMDGGPVMDDMGMGIEMEAPTMDTGDVVLGPEDDVLRSLFANQETQDAEQAKAQQEGGEQAQQKQANIRTASTRTVGTRPTQGVSRVGGGAAAPAPAAGGEINKLSALWPSAPDVSEAFGINK